MVDQEKRARLQAKADRYREQAQIETDPARRLELQRRAGGAELAIVLMDAGVDLSRLKKRSNGENHG